MNEVAIYKGPYIGDEKYYVRLDAYTSLKAKCDALANDNLVLKSAIECHMAGFSVCEACGEDNTCGNDDVGIVLKEIPATDAYANQLRAEGAASVVTLIRACAHEFPDSAEDIVEECAMISDSRAINLRKEHGHD